jgi:hypothetical protein
VQITERQGETRIPLRDPQLSFCRTVVATASLLWAPVPGAHAATDPLPSWNERLAKPAIVSFSKEVKNKSGPNAVTLQDRFATFDQDGTLWVEHPWDAQAR